MTSETLQIAPNDHVTDEQIRRLFVEHGHLYAGWLELGRSILSLRAERAHRTIQQAPDDQLQMDVFLEHWLREVPEGIRPEVKARVRLDIQENRASTNLEVAWETWQACCAYLMSREKAPVISTEDSLRTRLRWSQEKVEQLQKENRVLRGRIPGASFDDLMAAVKLAPRQEPSTPPPPPSNQRSED